MFATALENYKQEIFEEGIEKGRLEGERNKAIETARAMKSEGLDLRLIAKVTGLSIKEIEEL